MLIFFLITFLLNLGWKLHKCENEWGHIQSKVLGLGLMGNHCSSCTTTFLKSCVFPGTEPREGKDGLYHVENADLSFVSSF